MFERFSLIGIGFSVAIIVMDFYVLRKRRVQGKAFVLWFMIGLIVGLFSSVPYLFELLTILFGTQQLASAVTATGILFLLLMVFYLHYRLSEIQSQLMKLAMETSVAKYDPKQTAQNTVNPQCEDMEEQKSKDE